MPTVLLLSTTFFPDPRVASVRVSQWARCLPEFGWKPVVLCKHSGYRADAKQLAEVIHPDVQVEYFGPRVAKSEPSSEKHRDNTTIKDRLRKLAEDLSVPDVSIHRWPSMLDEALQITQRIQPDVILSTSPPCSIHWLGRRLAEKVKSKWVADFRDPHLIDCRFQPRGWRTPLWPLHKRFEHQIYNHADLVIHTIPLHGRWASRAYPEARAKVKILQNGAPTNLLDQNYPDPSTGKPLSLRAVGHLAPESPKLLYEAIQLLSSNGYDVNFRHVGHKPSTVDDLPEDATNRMLFRGGVPHDEAMREVAGADLLLAYLSEDRAKYKGISSKLFEYLATGKPIIVVNPTSPDRYLIRNAHWCVPIDRPDATELSKAIARLIDERPRPTEAWREAFRLEFDRHNQSRLLASWLDELIYKP